MLYNLHERLPVTVGLRYPAVVEAYAVPDILYDLRRRRLIDAGTINAVARELLTAYPELYQHLVCGLGLLAPEVAKQLIPKKKGN